MFKSLSLYNFALVALAEHNIVHQAFAYTLCLTCFCRCFCKITDQNSCHLASSPLTFCHHLSDPVISPPPVYSMSPKPPRNSAEFGLVSAEPFWLAHFASFWVDANYHKARSAKGQKLVRRETAGTTGAGFRNLATQWASFVELHGTSPCSVNFSSAHKLHFIVLLKGWVTDAACGRYVHKSCYQINRITMHTSWASFESLRLNLHIQLQASHFIAQQIKLLPNQF